MKKEIEPIKTNRLLLREIVESDIQNIYNGLSHPLVIKYYGVSYDTLESTKEQMKWFEASSQCWWAICSLDNREFYGAAGLNDISVEHKKAEIGLWLLPDFWGEGLMSEVMPIICRHGFDKLGLQRIEGFVDSENQKCKRAMSKLDFEYEGTMKNCEIKDGRYISLDIFAKLKN